MVNPIYYTFPALPSFSSVLSRSGIERLYAPISAIFKASAPTLLAACAASLFIATKYDQLSYPVGAVAVAAFGLGALGVYKQLEAKVSTQTALTQRTVINDSPAPIGLPNGGNHCCFISALQVLINTSSWMRDVLQKNTAVKPVLDAYATGHTSTLNFEEIRQGVDIYEENHFRNQEDPAAYIRALAATANKQLSIQARYCSKEGAQLSDRGILPPDDPLISLGIPRTGSSINLNGLLENYFCSPFEGYYSPSADKLVEEPGKQTLIKKSLAGSPPEDLMIQIKRFGFETPQSTATNALSLTWFQELKLWILRVLGLYSEDLPQPTSTGGARDFKIKKAISTPLTLEMKPEWFEGQTTPVSYECQSFLCHLGERIQSGHYISYVRKGDTWYKCNDAIVEPISTADAQEALQQSYILSYRKVC